MSNNLIPSTGGDFSALWVDEGEDVRNAPVVAWRIEDGRVVEAVALGQSSSVVWTSEGFVVDLASGQRWDSEPAWRADVQGSPPEPLEVRQVELEAFVNSPPRPVLTPEWRIVITTSSGAVTVVPVDSEAGAVEVGKRLRHSVWTLERRMVGPWVAVVQPVRTVVSLEPAENPGGFNGQGA